MAQPLPQIWLATFACHDIALERWEAVSTNKDCRRSSYLSRKRQHMEFYDKLSRQGLMQKPVYQDRDIYYLAMHFANVG